MLTSRTTASRLSKILLFDIVALSAFVVVVMTFFVFGFSEWNGGTLAIIKKSRKNSVANRYAGRSLPDSRNLFD